MKTIVIIIFIFFIGFSANAQASNKEIKVETFTYGVELNFTTKKASIRDNQTARVYMYRNSRIKKALSFKTKRNKSKMA